MEGKFSSSKNLTLLLVFRKKLSVNFLGSYRSEYLKGENVENIPELWISRIEEVANKAFAYKEEGFHCSESIIRAVWSYISPIERFR